MNKGKKIKCVVWDLDNTLWEGILTEDEVVTFKEDIKKIIIELDQRGIIQSIASKNNEKDALNKLKEFGMEQYFIYPQINWSAKSESVKKIPQLINIGIDTIAFIDDQEFELEEVKFLNPEVLCIHIEELSHLLEREEFIPRFITEDSKTRRKKYQEDIKRKKEEESFGGTQNEFIKTLHMKIEISQATIDDLKRVEELTIRTHQLNSTGYTYSYEELCGLLNRSDYKIFVVNLKDRFGDYGKIGIVLIECHGLEWVIKLFLLSCRVMSRGISGIVLNYMKNLAKKSNSRLCAEFIPTEKNRMMYITLTLNGFVESKTEKGLLVYNNSAVEDYPAYIEVISV
jgi:FkbH-like protein